METLGSTTHLRGKYCFKSINIVQNSNLACCLNAGIRIFQTHNVSVSLSKHLLLHLCFLRHMLLIELCRDQAHTIASCWTRRSRSARAIGSILYAWILVCSCPLPWPTFFLGASYQLLEFVQSTTGCANWPEDMRDMLLVIRKLKQTPCLVLWICPPCSSPGNLLAG